MVELGAVDEFRLFLSPTRQDRRTSPPSGSSAIFGRGTERGSRHTASRGSNIDQEDADITFLELQVPRRPRRRKQVAKGRFASKKMQLQPNCTKASVFTKSVFRHKFPSSAFVKKIRSSKCYDKPIHVAETQGDSRNEAEGYRRSRDEDWAITQPTPGSP